MQLQIKRTLFVWVVCASATTANHATNATAQDIHDHLPLKWTADIGQISYRTLPALTNGRLFVGSNGNYFRDFRIEDAGGVYILEPATGEVVGKIGAESWGDLDVNGVVAHGGRVFFGNDNDEFMCYDGGTLEPVWRLPVSCDVEHAPSLVRFPGGRMVVVFATECGEVRAVNPADGETVWVHYADDFAGWRPGKTRFVYRVAAATLESPWIYFAPPAEVEVDGDGVVDLVYSRTGGQTVALSGLTGATLFALDSDANALSTPLILSSPQGPVLLTTSAGRRVRRFLLPSGRELPSTPLPLDYLTLPRSSVPGNDRFLVLDHDEKLLRLQAVEPVVTELAFRNRPRFEAWTTFVGHETINWRGEAAFMRIVEYDRVRESAVLAVNSVATQQPLATFTLPHTTESMPHLLDVDGDGRLELLYGSADGVLYCHEIPQQQ